MQTVYFEDRFILISSATDNLYAGDTDSVIYFPGENSAIEDIPCLFEKAPYSRLVIHVKNKEKQQIIFDRIFSRMELVEAGGGLIVNDKGEYLMIIRNGRWDLPKGKREDGEDIRNTALREVMEECGTSMIEITAHICDTYHTYHRDGRSFLKCTHWYGMTYTGDGTDISPQKDENIEQAIWVDENKLKGCLPETYPSIREVFRSNEKNNA